MDAAPVLDALGDPTRRALLDLLRTRARTVGELADALPVSRPAVSKHLRVLEAAGLVDFDVEGTRRRYRIEPRGLRNLRAFVDRMWDDALASFETVAGAVAHTDPRPTSSRRKR